MNFLSLSSLLSSVSDRADMPPLTTTTFITKAQMTRWLNASGRRLAGKLIAHYGAGHYETTQDIVMTVGQDYYEWEVSPTSELSIFQLLYLRVTLDGERVRLHQAGEGEMDWEDTNDTDDWSVSNRPVWRFREYGTQKILFSITPRAAHTVTVHYVPYFVFVNNAEGVVSKAIMSDETNDGIWDHLGWGEWVILDCAIKAMKRQGMPSDEWMALQQERDEIEQEWKPLAKRVQRPKRIQSLFYSDKVGDGWPAS